MGAKAILKKRNRYKQLSYDRCFAATWTEMVHPPILSMREVFIERTVIELEPRQLLSLYNTSRTSSFAVWRHQNFPAHKIHANYNLIWWQNSKPSRICFYLLNCCSLSAQIIQIDCFHFSRSLFFICSHKRYSFRIAFIW